MKACAICGTEFQPRRRQIYCKAAACAKERTRRRNAAYDNTHPGARAANARKWESKNPERANATKYASNVQWRQRRRNALMMLIAFRALIVDQLSRSASAGHQ